MEPAPPRTYLAGWRRPWRRAPPEVTSWVETQLGGPVVTADDRIGGMSTGIASVVGDGNGRKLFVKAVNATENPGAAQLMADEIAAMARLPALPHVPTICGAVELRSAADRWRVITTPAVDGRPVRHPWRPDALQRVLPAWDEVAVDLAGVAWPTQARLAPFFGAWTKIAADGDDPWRDLATAWPEREDRVVALTAGTDDDPPVLSHLDLRADNILVAGGAATGPDGVWFVDWAHPGLAARWVDVALLLADVVGSGAEVTGGGPIDVVDVWRRHPVCGCYDPELVITTISGLAAALHLIGRAPPDEKLPHRQAWAAALADQLTPFVRRYSW